MGIPVVQISAVTPAARMVGVSRILRGTAITNPYGDDSLPPEHEKDLRRRYIRRAVELLGTDVEKTTIFTLEGVEQ